MIELDLGVFSRVKGFASNIASPHNTIKNVSDGFPFCPLITTEVLRLYNKSDDDWTGFRRILVG
jgi:hypothetical protein